MSWVSIDILFSSHIFQNWHHICPGKQRFKNFWQTDDFLITFFRLVEKLFFEKRSQAFQILQRGIKCKFKIEILQSLKLLFNKSLTCFWKLKKTIPKDSWFNIRRMNVDICNVHQVGGILYCVVLFGFPNKAFSFKQQLMIILQICSRKTFLSNSRPTVIDHWYSHKDLEWLG